jgi:hypothetical protein
LLRHDTPAAQRWIAPAESGDPAETWAGRTRLPTLVDAAPDLERLADVPLNIVCFRSKPPGYSDAELDEHNRRLGAALLSGVAFFRSVIVTLFRRANVTMAPRRSLCAGA